MGEYSERNRQSIRAAFKAGGIPSALTALFHDEAMQSVAQFGHGPADAPDLSQYAHVHNDPFERYLPHGALAEVRASLLRMITDAGEPSREFARTLLKIADTLPDPGKYETGFMGMMQCQLDGLVSAAGIPIASSARKAPTPAAPDGPTHFAMGPVNMWGGASPVEAGVRH